MCRDVMTRKNYADLLRDRRCVPPRRRVSDHREGYGRFPCDKGGLEKSQRREVERLKEDKRRAESGMTSAPAALPDFEPHPTGRRRGGWIGIVELLLELVSGR
jgi:hypothetical protein